jgi:hypothetical protein
MWVCRRAHHTLKVQPILKETLQGEPAKSNAESQVPIVTPHVTISQTQKGTTVMPDGPGYSNPFSRLPSSGTFGHSKNTKLNSTSSEHQGKKAMNPQ